MKKLVLTLALLAGVVAGAQDIGIYPSTTWASTNLLINRALEAGQVGQVIGYTAPGIIGLTTGGSGGGDTVSLDARVAALSEFRPVGTNGTRIAPTNFTFIGLNHLYDPTGLFTAFDTNSSTFRITPGTYAVTVVVPAVAEQNSGGSNKIPFVIGLWDVTGNSNVYYSTYTIYDDDRSQYTSVFMPVWEASGDHDYAVRIGNLSPTIALLCGADAGISGTQNHYTEVQVLKLSGAISGIRPNVVASVTDLATLTNTVTGYTRAIVGTATPGINQLYQLEQILFEQIPTNRIVNYNPPAGGNVTYNLTNGEVTISGQSSGTLGLSDSLTNLVVGQRYRLRFSAKANEASGFFASSYYGNPIWTPNDLLTTTMVDYTLEMTAMNEGAKRLLRLAANNVADSLTIKNWSIATFADDDFPSADTNFVWRQVALESPGGSTGLTQTSVVIDDNADTFPTAYDYVYFTYPPGSWSLTGPNVLPDGVDGQVITLLNENNAGDPYTISISDDANGADGLGTNINTGSTALTMSGKTFHVFTFSAATSLWNYNGVVITALPAPWPPPDENGEQRLDDIVKLRLLQELVPYLLTNYPMVFPAGPLPGSSTNLIVVP